MVKHPIKLPLLKASDSSRSRDHDRKMKSEGNECGENESNQLKDKEQFFASAKRFQSSAYGVILPKLNEILTALSPCSVTSRC